MSKPTQIEPLFAQLAKLSPGGYFVGLHIRGMAPFIMRRTYDPDWIEHYDANSFALRDPTVAWALSRTGTCRWSALDLPDPFDIVGAAARFGIHYGAVASHGPLASRSIIGVARHDREFTDAELGRVLDLLEQMHEAARPPALLTQAEVEALQMVAGGMRYAQAAGELGISQSAIKARLASARRKLAARTTPEAIERARAGGFI